MVRILIAMRAAALRNARQSRFGTVALIGGATAGLATAVSTLLVGAITTAGPYGGAAQLGLVMLSWMAGRIGFAAFSGGDPAVPLDLFRIIPARRTELARSLLMLGLLDPAMPFLAIAFAAVVVYGFRLGGFAGLIGLLTATASLVLVSFLSTIVAAIVPTGSRRRQDIGLLLSAAVISGVVVLGTLIPALFSLLAKGRLSALAVVLRVLPSGWAVDAVARAGSGHRVLALLPLLGLAAGCISLFIWWPHVLAARLLGQASSARRRHGRRRRLLPATATGAVVSRELRLWIRDPNRAGFLLIAAVVGLGICAVPLISRGTTLLLPFAGCGTAIIAGAVAANVYGFDGRSIAVVLDAAAESADLRGRRVSWFLLIGPYSIVLTVIGMIIAHADWAWPWALGLLAAILGGAVGITPVVSLLAPQPLDGSGSPGPAWVAKAYLAIALIAVSTAPTLALLVLGTTTADRVISWLALPTGVGSGIATATILGGVARRLLVDRGPEIYQSLADAGTR